MNERFASVWDALPPGLRNATKSPQGPLAGAGGTVSPASAENSAGAVFRVLPIASSNWTNDTETVTPARDTNDGELSNES